MHSIITEIYDTARKDGYCMQIYKYSESNRFHSCQFTKALIKIYRETWKDQFELFCDVVIEKNQKICISSATLRQIDKGRLQIAQNIDIVFIDQNIKQLQVKCMYKNHIEFFEIKTLLSQTQIKKRNKYKNSLLLQNRIKYLNHKKSSGGSKQKIVDRFQQKPPKILTVQSQLHINQGQRKLKLCDKQSQSQEYYNRDKLSSIALFSMNQKSHQSESDEVIEVKIIENESISSLTANMALKRIKSLYQNNKIIKNHQNSKQKPKNKEIKTKDTKPKPASKKQIKIQQIQKQTSFMNGWLSKSKSN